MMIADIVIPFFEWWMVPTLLTILSIWFFSANIETNDGGTMAGALGMMLINLFVWGFTIIVITTSWLVYFIFN